MRKMFGKVFLAFWTSSLVLLLAVIALGIALGNRPLLYLWWTRSLEFYSRTAVDLYEHGGQTALSRYLDDIRSNSGIDSVLIDPHGTTLAGRSVPEQVEAVLARTKETSRSQYDRQHWSAAILVHGSQGNYILAARIHRWRREQIVFLPSIVLSRLLAAFFMATLLCLIMARYLTKPIRDLQKVARRIAAGDLSARATPLLAKRHDELAELAFDFDLMAGRVQRMIERQQTLLRDISHELRSPLTRMALSAELVRRGDTGALHRIETDIKRLEEMIAELLTLSRMEASERNTRQDEVNVAHMTRQIVQDAAFEGRPEGKNLVQTGRDDLIVVGDANLLQRCIENVVRNAVHYTKAGTTVEIHLAQATMRDQVQVAALHVMDEGPGVPSDALPHLFEPFFRVSQSRDHQDGGVGLGLSISHRIAALHGGKIEAANRLQGGLEVTIYLPLIQK